MVEAEGQKIFEEIHILLALERNYLAEERTALAEFRTGLTLVLIAVPATTIVAFIFSRFPLEGFFLLDLANFMIFAIIAALGIWISLRSQSRLKKIKAKKKMVRNHKATVIRGVKATNDLLGKFIVLEEEMKN